MIEFIVCPPDSEDIDYRIIFKANIEELAPGSQIFSNFSEEESYNKNYPYFPYAKNNKGQWYYGFSLEYNPENLSYYFEDSCKIQRSTNETQFFNGCERIA